MSFFKKIDISIPKDKQLEKVENQFLHYEEHPELIFVTDDYNKRQISYIRNALQKVFKQNIPSFALLYSFIYKAKDNEITKNITDFMYKYACDYTKYIPDGSRVICIGRSIYSFTLETSFNAEAFYPYDYVDTYFFHPDTKSFIFPVDDLFKFTSFEEKRFLDNFNSFFFFKQIQRAYSTVVPKLRIPDLQVEIVEDPNAFLLEMKDKVSMVAWDLETGGFIYYQDEIVCITMTFDGITGYYLDYQKTDLNLLNEFFKDKFQIGANLKFDCRFLRSRGVSNAKIDFDTLNAGHVLNETASNALSSHGWRYTYYGGHEIELQRYRKAHPKLKSYAQIPKSILAQYAVKDAIICFQAYQKQMEFLEKDQELKQYYFSQVVPNLNMFLEIELNGVLIDWDHLKKLNTTFEEKKAELSSEIYELLGFEVNLASNKDLGIALETRANLPDLGMRSKAGLYLTNEESLNTWTNMGYEVAAKILEYRSTCNQINTFIGSEENNNAYWKYKNNKTDTVHPSYGVMLAQSHRNKCSSPNFQQIPKSTSTAKDFRRIFITPSPSYFIAEGDFSAFQLRIAAVLSGDQNLKDAFVKYGDVHSMTAVAIFHRDMSVEDFMKVKHDHPYKEQRDIAKTTNFRFLFGGSAYSFADSELRLAWTEEYCENFINDLNIHVKNDSDNYYAAAEYIRASFFKQYPELEKWHEKCHEEARQTGAVRSIYGARRLLPKLTHVGRDTTKKEINDDQNVSKNSGVQTIEAVIIMRAMRELHAYSKDNNLESRLFGMIHDSVAIYIHKHERPEVVKQTLEIFQRDYPEYNGMKMVFELELSDTSEGEVWGFGHEVTS